MPSLPNIVIILTDDLGYGDLSCYGHPVIRTPNLDRLASEGQRWTNFYASSPLCNPSRTALMTGRLPIRIHEGGLTRWANLPSSEITIADMLKEEGYATCYVGKWGLCGNFARGGLHPNDAGFDHYFGLVGSNDAPLRERFKRTYNNIKNATSEDFPISLYRQRETIETPAYQPTLTKRYTEESVNWIKQQTTNDDPFFLFLGHTMPHVPIFCSPDFEGHSKAGRYGDVIEEIDWSVGQIREALEEGGIADNTIVFFSSDNGPWLTYYDLGGSPGPLRDGKVTSWEGGFRVPGIFWGSDIEPAVIDDLGVNIDLIATMASLTDATLPQGRILDSLDLSETLLNGASSPRTEWMFYGQPGNLWGARVGNHKLVLESWDSVGKEEDGYDWRGYGNHQTHDPPLLFDLNTDIAERHDIAAEKPETVNKIQQTIERHQRTLTDPES